MERRELIKMIALLTGGSVIGADLFLAGCKNPDSNPGEFFTGDDIAFLDEVAETIIPKTGTPGAKDAETGKFIALYAKDCYDETNRKILKEGMTTLNEATKKKYGSVFLTITPAQRQEMLVEVDKEAKDQNKDQKEPHYFTLIKQLTLLGFFTSKPGATQVLRYNPVPGKYEGCIDYKKGETSWA